MAFRYFRDDEPRPIADSLDRIAGRIGAPKADACGAVFSRWADVVGAGVAAHTRPVSLTGGRLVVAVDDPAWATQLRFLEGDIRARIEAVSGAGTVSELVVRVRPATGRR